eukprot:CAMPEP_0115463464 /NCGR_PEP_ID=MMETSP0271-20121206/48363_1 /TAXON_ID=71861 /ORGANISM="Scrippsiella trochoidea, Strain CCMP3099" /LENGTH=325 /DNA_ID=CAMNT_0002890303 /DNA_START=18 /DNA_END=996 /DNA_ORIENTATION=+
MTSHSEQVHHDDGLTHCIASFLCTNALFNLRTSSVQYRCAAHPHLMGLLAAKASRGDMCQRRAALTALGELAEAGDMAAASAAAACLGHFAWSVRWTAVGAFRQLIKRSGARAAGLAQPAAESPNAAVREAAHAALGKLAAVSDASVVSAASSYLQHADPANRWAALTVIRQLAASADECIVAAVINSLSDSDPSVRSVAATTLADIAKPADLAAIVALEACRSDVDRRVHRAATISTAALGRTATCDSLKLVGETLCEVERSRPSSRSLLVPLHASAQAAQLEAAAHARAIQLVQGGHVTLHIYEDFKLQVLRVPAGFIMLRRF